MEMLSAERQHFLQSLNGLLKELKDSLSEPKKIQADAEISEICFETRELKLFQDEVRHPHCVSQPTSLNFMVFFLLHKTDKVD